MKNQITVGTTDGKILCYHANTSKLIFEINENISGDRQINSFDYSLNSTQIIVVGAESSVRLYDVEKQSLISNFQESGIIPKHTNRVFSCKFLPDQNTFITSGWDQRILWWDTRTEAPFDSVHETQIYGDGLDVKEGLILASNFSDNNQIKLYNK